jgi:hypothetical protein
MLNKSLIAAAAVAAVAAGFSATAAQAGKLHVDVGIGLYDPYYGYGYGYGFGGYPVYDDYYGGGHHGHHGGSWGVSCGAAKDEVRGAHFHKVKTVDCSGKTYTFTGWKHGDKFRIKVSRKHGEIISVSALY